VGAESEKLRPRFELFITRAFCLYGSVAAENVATPLALKTRSMNDFIPQPDVT